MAKRKITLVTPGVVTPGEVLRNDFLAPMGISAYRLAADTGMTQTRVKEIFDGTRSVTADAALRLGRFFGTDAQWWLNMQAYYDLEKTKEENGREIVRAVKPWQHAA